MQFYPLFGIKWNLARCDIARSNFPREIYRCRLFCKYIAHPLERSLKRTILFANEFNEWILSRWRVEETKRNARDATRVFQKRVNKTWRGSSFLLREILCAERQLNNCISRPAEFLPQRIPFLLFSSFSFILRMLPFHEENARCAQDRLGTTPGYLSIPLNLAEEAPIDLASMMRACESSQRFYF